MSTSRKISPTIRDLAKALGLSKSTVHEALQNHPKLPLRTRRRVQEAAAKLGYRRNPVISTLTQELRKGRESNMRETICYLYSHEPDVKIWQGAPWGDFIEGAVQRSHELGFNLEVFHRPGKTIRSLKRVLETRGIRGILVAPLPGDAGELDFDWSRFASVTVGYQMSQPQLHSVRCEHLEVMRIALMELEKRGYRRLGLVMSDKLDLYDKRTLLAEFSLENGPLGKKSDIPVFLFKAAEPSASHSSFLSWYRTYSPEVILTPERRVLDWMKNLGLRIPEDVGFLHLTLCDHNPHLSGVDHRDKIVGAHAAQFLISNLIMNEIGIPKISICQLVEPIWREGETLRKIGQEPEKPVAQLLKAS